MNFVNNARADISIKHKTFVATYENKLTTNINIRIFNKIMLIALR